MRLSKLILLLLAGPAAWAQSDAPATVIRTETRVVLVDAIVTDKKGNYIHDLKSANFKVYEDGKEQTISSFTAEADPASGTAARPRYMVLFFDNSAMNVAQQAQARQAAVKFIGANAGPNRLMAIANYAGSLQIAQNFTDNVERLQQIASGLKFSAVASNADASPAGLSLSRAEMSFGVNSGILALKSLVKNLGTVPGRKSLILLTGGFALIPDNMSDLNSLVDMCNRSNVAVYPIDVRGLVATVGANRPPAYTPEAVDRSPFRLAAFGMSSPGISYFQKPGGGGGGTPGGGGLGGGGGNRGGGTPGGGTVGGPGSGGGRTGGSGGTGGTGGIGGTGGRTPITSPGGGRTPVFTPTNPNNSPRIFVPKFPESASTNQQPLYMLANGTGGFVIVNTNDLLGGLDKIGKEQNEYYMIGYTPDSSEDRCHTLKVKVDVGGATVRYRTGYCSSKPVDLLVGQPIEKDLENFVKGSDNGSVEAALQAPFFYTSGNTVRVTAAISIPTEAWKFEKHKGKFHGEMNLLGIAYRQDGTVAARFSDSVKLDFDSKKALDAFYEKSQVNFRKEFEAVPGVYTLKVVFNVGSGFGKLEIPMNAEAGDNQLRASAIAFSQDFHPVAKGDAAVDSSLTDDRTPLIYGETEFIPTGVSRFKKSERVAVYMQAYELPLLSANPPAKLAVAVRIRVLDRKSNAVKQDSGMMQAGVDLKPENAMLPVAFKLPIETLDPGQYKVELSLADTAGRTFQRAANFDVLQ